VEQVYEQAIAAPAQPTTALRADRRAGSACPPTAARVRRARLPSLDPEPSAARAARPRAAIGLGGASRGSLGIGLTAPRGATRSGSTRWSSIVRSDRRWVLVAPGLMAASMLLARVLVRDRARRAAAAPLRRRDVTSATMIGVLMSATLPARLGEPARAMVARPAHRPMRETFPVLLGTLVSQTVLNIVALSCWA
jgi:phosphatidylinositol alpha-mannosyltransferase